jgi:hypothetical protein
MRPSLASLNWASAKAGRAPPQSEAEQPPCGVLAESLAPLAIVGFHPDVRVQVEALDLGQTQTAPAGRAWGLRLDLWPGFETACRDSVLRRGCVELLEISRLFGDDSDRLALLVQEPAASQKPASPLGHLARELTDVLRARRGDLVEGRPLFALRGRVQTIECDDMEVDVAPEALVEPLAKRDRAAAAVSDALVAGLSAQPAEDRLDEDLVDRREQLRLAGGGSEASASGNSSSLGSAVAPVPPGGGVCAFERSALILAIVPRPIR